MVFWQLIICVAEAVGAEVKNGSKVYSYYFKIEIIYLVENSICKHYGLIPRYRVENTG